MEWPKRGVELSWDVEKLGNESNILGIVMYLIVQGLGFGGNIRLNGEHF